ncbi:uncharacterized protein L969DRAFT_321844 [Mixia osmundae IAM 14324]|uniref:uncharacterized protein n=1 Tax=Mixia osmundae (strain CBS 9802 / IAM 14324 / JCM 22182 / KY 12970) TaxID=764103 RepID=UPI0004A54A58|nr:uncharacterized protein L969DRAFT_321844 [Mixia osmundae IAM 14324]KEI41654.1 hypothetical protein L969DRAFT_321844 [Mixia osmundae IAM 14324]
MPVYSRPETALRRAEELISVGQPSAALSTLTEMIGSKRFRQTPLASLEPIMVKFLDLCVQLKKGRTAKEGLHTYKNVAQNTSVGSVEVVMNRFIERSKAKLQEALDKVDELEGPAPENAAPASEQTGKSQTTATAHAEPGTVKAAISEDVEDLEASETPEGLLLSAVSEESSRDRTYRTLVTPWLRFLWEAYRTSLDILRNNARLEVGYQNIASEAYKFCLQHGRKTEFRRLCDNIKNHLATSQSPKAQAQNNSINLNEAETLTRFFETRFQQLGAAVELELWQEAFRTAEEIHKLIAMSKRAPKAHMMATFYDRMVKVFGVGENYLFHAAAYGKLYSIYQAPKSEDEATAAASAESLASLVLLSALAVPISGGLAAARRKDLGSEDGEAARGKVLQLVNLLGLSVAPARATLIRDALARGALKRASSEIQELYAILETDFQPLLITRKIGPLLAKLAANPDYTRYVDPLKEVVLARLFQQLAQVYDTIKLSRAVKLASFAKDEDAALVSLRLERFVTAACRRGELDVTLDHSSGLIKFDQDLFGSFAGNEAASLKSHSLDVLQPMPSILLRTNLSRLAQGLYATLDHVAPAESSLTHAVARREAALAALAQQVPLERQAYLDRQRVIARRKELHSENEARKKEEEQHQRAIRTQLQADEAQRREREDLQKRELEKLRKLQEQNRLEEVKKLAESMAGRPGLKVDLTNLESLDKDRLLQMSVQQIEKDKKEMAEKLRIVAKRMDHIERAYRQEEQPLLSQDYERQQTRDREAHEYARTMLIANLKSSHTQDLALNKRLRTVLSDYESFKTNAEKDSREQHEKKLADAKIKIDKEKAKRRATVLAARAAEQAERERKEREAREQEEREEAERLGMSPFLDLALNALTKHIAEKERLAAEKEAAAEAERKKVADEKAKLDAEIALRKAEREEQRAKDAALLKQRQQREEEAERRRLEKNKPSSGQPMRIASRTESPAGGEGAAWRSASATGGPPARSFTPPVRSQASTPSTSAGGRPRIVLAPRTVSSSDTPKPTVNGNAPAKPATGTDAPRQAYRPPGAR